MSGIDVFASGYLGKIFYFCLKKTGNEQDAAELAGEISLEVVQTLSKGKEPERFDPWLWAVARNRWARWAAKKYYRTPEQVDIQEYEQLLPSEQCLEEDFIHSQELTWIRRELAFVRSEYRQILVAHYFEERSVSEISRRFGVPIGTVKTRLQNSRRILKEGMSMARQFGSRSFNPETIHFNASGNQPSGLPWSAVKRKIPVNILCEASNNPSTVEELSMELGIAVPYMEEEVEILEKAELLRKLDGGRYITGFFISPRECQNEINELSCQFAERHYTDIWMLAGKAYSKAGEYGLRSDAVSDMDAQAYFAFYIEQQLSGSMLPPGIFYKFRRRDGGSWGFIGKEEGASCRVPHTYFNNNWVQTTGETSILWNGYQCSDTAYGRRPYSRDTPEEDSLAFIRELALTPAHDPEDLSVTETQYLKSLLKNGFCVKNAEGEIRVAALIFAGDVAQNCREYYCALPEYRSLEEKMKEYMQSVRAIISRYSVPYLKEDFEYYVGMSTELRHLLATLWKKEGLYRGGNAQFMALYC